MMKRLVVAFALFLAAAPSMAQPAAPVVPATAMTPTPDDRAKQWLTLLDDGNYADGYKQMGAAATAKISADAWTQKITGVRAPLGAMSSRNLKDVKVAGQRATIRYDSGFAHRATAVETLILASDKTGWSVIDYRID